MQQCAVWGMVCALVTGFYGWSANSGMLELMGSGAGDSYYNLLVRGFQDGHLSVKREAPPNLGDLAKMKWEDNYDLDDLSYYKGKLYLYFGVTPAVALFWPYVGADGALPVAQGRDGRFSSRRDFWPGRVCCGQYGGDTSRKSGLGWWRRGCWLLGWAILPGDIGAVRCL